MRSKASRKRWKGFFGPVDADAVRAALPVSRSVRRSQRAAPAERCSNRSLGASEYRGRIGGSRRQ